MVRMTDTMVYLYHKHELIATHPRGRRKGERMTTPAHYPAEKAAFLEKTVVWCRHRAKAIGSNMALLVETLLHHDHPMDTLRKVQGILHLGDKYPKDRMDLAARRALHFHLLTYRSFKSILESGMDRQPLEEVLQPSLPAVRSFTFARPITDFIPLTNNLKEAKYGIDPSN
jgi:hypothetical protein